MSWRTRSIKHRQGLWPLNGHAQDMSGYGNHGTLVNAPTWATNQFGRQCIEFDGNDAHVNVGDLTYLNSVAAFTIAFWMNQVLSDAADIIFDKIVGSDIIDIRTTTSGVGTLRCTITGTYGQFIHNVIVSASSWHHVAWVFDGSGVENADRLKCYTDEIPQTLGFNGVIPAATSDLATGEAHIGRASSSFNGKLFDFQIFDVPLSQDEVNSVMRGHD